MTNKLSMARVCVAYFVQFEFEFLAGVPVWTSVNLLTGTGL